MCVATTRCQTQQPCFCGSSSTRSFSSNTRATQARADAFAEEIIAISDTPLQGVRTEEGTNADGEFSKEVREDMIAHRKLQVDAKWLMARMQPKKYGDKIEQTLKGDADAPLLTRVELVDGEPSELDTAGDDGDSAEG